MQHHLRFQDLFGGFFMGFGSCLLKSKSVFQLKSLALVALVVAFCEAKVFWLALLTIHVLGNFSSFCAILNILKLCSGVLPASLTYCHGRCCTLK